MSVIAAEIRNLASVPVSFQAWMFDKLVSKAERGWLGWDDSEAVNDLRIKMLEHAQKLYEGDDAQAADVANLAMMIWNMGGRP